MRSVVVAVVFESEPSDYKSLKYMANECIPANLVYLTRVQ